MPLAMAGPDPDIALPAQERAIRAKCFHRTGTFVSFPPEAVEQSLPERFEEQVRRLPQRPAVTTRHHALTYAELDTLANQIAHAILRRCRVREEAVALLFDHDALAIAAMLGALKAGTPYLPLDTAYPRQRIDYILRDSAATLLLTDARNLALARELVRDSLQVVSVDAIDAAPTRPHAPAGPRSVAYILYTSGSTGHPKGIVQDHRNVLHEVRHYTNSAHFCTDDRFLLVSSISFGDSVRTIYSALLNGASLYPFDIRLEGLGGLAAWMREQGVTIYRSVPTTFRHFVGSLKGGEGFPALRLIYLGGEPVYPTDVELYKRHFPRECILVNRLGTTETLTFRYAFLDHDAQITGHGVPVGYPVAGKEVVLVDEKGEPVACGEVGEMAVRSRYLSPGFWRKPELTRAAFATDPVDPDLRLYRTGDLGRLRHGGCLEHLGRTDFQVKVRGHRVETWEIEAALLGLDAFREALVVAQPRGSDHRLVAYVVPAALPVPDVSTLRRLLAARLPGYMLPAAYVVLEALPLLPNGKVDRRALPEPGTARPALEGPFVAPRSAGEEAIARIWMEVIGIDRVGVHDSFLDLGGDSLMATRIIVRVTAHFDVTLPGQALWQASTVAAMAELVAAALPLEPRPGGPRRVLAPRAADWPGV